MTTRTVVGPGELPGEVVDVDPTASIDDAGSLSGWLHTAPARQKPPRRVAPAVAGLLRFAFYGRISTGEYQDATSSRAWQLDSARQVIAGRGRIVEEFFDVGCSRRLPWTARPQATALLAAATSTNRPFDAVVVGEYERAFHGDQLPHIAAALASHGVQLWLPETNGAVDLNDPAHQALTMLLGHQSNREILRSRFRTTMAMTAQARDQNRLDELRLQQRRHDLGGDRRTGHRLCTRARPRRRTGRSLRHHRGDRPLAFNSRPTVIAETVRPCRPSSAAR